MQPTVSSTEVFWISWALTLGLGCFQLLRAWRQPRELLGFATVASVMWLYVYVYLPYHLISAERQMLPAKIWNLGEFTAGVGLASLLAAWHWKLSRKGKPTTPHPAALDYNRIWWSGILALVIGLIGYHSFKMSGREFESASAYWYLSFNLCYSGIALCILALSKSPPRRSGLNQLLLVGLASAIIVPMALGARRGPTFVAIMTVFLPFAAVRRRPLRPAVILSVLVCAGLVLLLQVTARRVTYDGGTWMEFLGSVRIEELTEERASRTSDNEFYNHCVELQANLETGRYQYGTSHLAMLLNWIPRSWWPDKPQRSLGLFPEAMYAAERAEGSNLGFGGGWGTVADAFNNYWFFFPIFFLVIGWATAAIFLKSENNDDTEWKMYNIGLLCATHWFVAQSIVEAFVPFMIYEGTFFLAFRYSRLLPVRQPRKKARLGTATVYVRNARRRTDL